MLPPSTFPILDEHPHCFGCTGQWDNHDTGAYCRYGQDPGKCEGPGIKPELCPVCKEKGEQVPMLRGRPTGFYYFYSCPRCGNLALREKTK
jgi:hypothetical protein